MNLIFYFLRIMPTAEQSSIPALDKLGNKVSRYNHLLNDHDVYTSVDLDRMFRLGDLDDKQLEAAREVFANLEKLSNEYYGDEVVNDNYSKMGEARGILEEILHLIEGNQLNNVASNGTAQTRGNKFIFQELKEEIKEIIGTE